MRTRSFVPTTSGVRNRHHRFPHVGTAVLDRQGGLSGFEPVQLAANPDVQLVPEILKRDAITSVTERRHLFVWCTSTHRDVDGPVQDRVGDDVTDSSQGDHRERLELGRFLFGSNASECGPSAAESGVE